MRVIRDRLHTTGKDLSEESVKKSDTPLLFDGHGASRALRRYQRLCHLASDARSNLAVQGVLRGFIAQHPLTLNVRHSPDE
jgi:hypothetical protein